MPCISKDCEPKARKLVRAQDPRISGKPPVTENSLEIRHFGGPLWRDRRSDFAVEQKIVSEFADDFKVLFHHLIWHIGLKLARAIWLVPKIEVAI